MAKRKKYSLKERYNYHWNRARSFYMAENNGKKLSQKERSADDYSSAYIDAVCGHVPRDIDNKDLYSDAFRRGAKAGERAKTRSENVKF